MECSGSGRLRCTHPRRERNRARRELIDATRERLGLYVFIKESFEDDTTAASRLPTRGQLIRTGYSTRSYDTIDALASHVLSARLEHLKDRSALDAFESWERKPEEIYQIHFAHNFTSPGSYSILGPWMSPA